MADFKMSVLSPEEEQEKQVAMFKVCRYAGKSIDPT